MYNYLLNLRKHLISPSKNSPLEELESYLQDVRCFAEHIIIGSTTLHVDMPWVPYALLSGRMNVKECNAKRKLIEQRGFPAGHPGQFGLSLDYRLFISLSPADHITFQVSLPRILKVVDPVNGLPVSDEEILKRNHFRGAYWNVRKIELCKKAIK